MDLLKLSQFFEVLNNHCESIKLKDEIHAQEINFLDATLFKGLLDTKIYFKRTDSHQLLHKQYFHPKHTFSDILKLLDMTEYVRIRRI